jgi:hypothetical protein
MSKPERQPLVQRRSEVDLAGGECRLPFFFCFSNRNGRRLLHMLSRFMK